MEKTNNKNSNFKELIRFIICGGVSALADYLFCQLVVLLFGLIPNFSSDEHWVLITVISTMIGFIAGVIVNYLLSTYWVYQNVREDIDTKSFKFKLYFVLLSFAAMLLSIGVMLLCNVIVMNGMGLPSIIELSLFSLIKEEGLGFLTNVVFWAFFISFVLKTLVGLIFNYFTRKYILYKSKPEE